MDQSVISFRVWPTDLDANIHMNNGRYLSIMDLGRLDYMARIGMMSPVLRHRWMPVLSSAIIRYRIPLHPFQKFQLQTRVVWWDEKWFYMEQRFIINGGQKHGAVAALAFIKGSLYDRREQSTVPTKTLTAMMGLSQAPEQPSHIASWMAAEENMKGLTA